MSSKSHAVIICEHLQARFDWWYSLYTSLLEVKAAYEKNQPFSATPHEDAALLDNLNDDADWAYQMSQSLASELCRAEEALAVKSQPKPKPQPQPAPEPEPEPIDVSDIPFALTDEKLPPVVSLANITQFCTYSESSCAAPNDRALMIYRRACNEGIISNGDKLIVTGDLDAVLNMDVEEWGELVTAADEKLPPVEALVNALNGIESAKRAAVETFADEYAHFVPNLAEIAESIRERLAIESAKAKPRKPYRVWQPKYKWPLTPRVVRVPLLGEVE